MRNIQPKAGDTWRFEGVWYTVLTVAKYSNANYSGIVYTQDLAVVLRELVECSSFTAQDVETKTLYEVYPLEDDTWFLRLITNPSKHHKASALVRTIDSFNKIVRTQPSNYYEFARW